MSTKSVAFFTEAGSSRGMGHLVRLHTIHEEFTDSNYKCNFFLDSDISYDYKFSDIHYFSWETFSLTQRYDIIFVDSYEASREIYQRVSDSCNQAFFLDDYERLVYPKGTIINFAPDAKELFYKKENAVHRLLLGLIYIPLRKLIKEIKVAKKEQLFIMLGGSDVESLSVEILASLEEIKLQKVIITNNAQILEELTHFANTSVLYQPSDRELLEAMASSTIAISTAGMSIYELAYYNIPTLIVSVSHNQRVGQEQLLKHKLAYGTIELQSQSWKIELPKQIEQLLASQTQWNTIIDENGAQRILKEAISL